MIQRKLNNVSVIVAMWFLVVAAVPADAVQDAESQRRPEQVLFFATDRNDTGSAEADQKYGYARSEMTYGLAKVAIPDDHRIGKSIPSDKNALVLSALDRPAFFQEIAKSVASSEEKSLFLYLHGYNVNFKEAAMSCAQIVNDLHFNGCALFFSWPSHGHITSYLADEASVLWSERDLEKLLESVVLNSGSKNIYLMAHSMGNRALTLAFLELARTKPKLLSSVKLLMLAAPDMDAGMFKRDIAPALASTGVKVTLYASTNDKALRLSKRLHAYPRAGEIYSLPLIAPGIETIDVTGVDDASMGHSYHCEARPVLSDIYYSMKLNLGADKRYSLDAIDTPQGRYWKFRE